MTISEKIKNAREYKDISLSELSALTGITKSSLQRYETASTKKIPAEAISEIEKALDLPAGYLMGWHDSQNILTLNDIYPKNTGNEYVMVPVLGRVAAGIPITAQEDILGWEEVPAAWTKNGTIFALKIKGDSMQPKIDDGDTVICRAQPDVENGDIAIVMVNGDEATCKRISKSADGITLISSNPKYMPMHYTNKQIEQLPVRILGKVIELRVKF